MFDEKITRNSPLFRFNVQSQCGYVALPLTDRLDSKLRFRLSKICRLPPREERKKRKEEGKERKERRMEAWKNLKLPPTDLEWLSGKRPNK